MSAHTTIKPSAHGSHNGRLSAGVFAVAAAVAGIGLAASLLVSAPTAPTSQQAPAFDAPAYRAEEHHLPAPAFDAPAFRAQERALQVLPAFDAPAFRTEERGFNTPPGFDAPGFRAQERDLTIP